MLTIILLSINILVATLLIGAVLIQKSEGGALGMGGGPSNFMSARGTGDLLTRVTWILFGVFLVISIVLTLLAASQRKPKLGEGIKLDPNEILKPKATLPPPGAPGSGLPADAFSNDPSALTPQASPAPITVPAPTPAPAEQKK